MKKILINSKRIAVALILAFTVVFSGAACHRVSGNKISYRRLPDELKNENGEIAFAAGRSECRINPDEKTFSYVSSESSSEQSDGESEETADPTTPVVSGGTTPRYDIRTAEGYEDIVPHIKDLDIEGSDRSVIYTQGYSVGDKVYGICNVYKDTVGYLSGGGNYGIEEIAYSVYYAYDAESDEFSVIDKLDDAVFVAFSGNRIIYWKSKKYYILNVDDGKSDYLFDDRAYDSGIRQQSRSTVYFNDDYAIIEMIKAKGTKDIYHMFVYDFNESALTELKSFEISYF